MFFVLEECALTKFEIRLFDLLRNWVCPIRADLCVSIVLF